MSAHKLVPVILSGGSGTRLWPVSREGYPKPFMRMPSGAVQSGDYVGEDDIVRIEDRYGRA